MSMVQADTNHRPDRRPPALAHRLLIGFAVAAAVAAGVAVFVAAGPRATAFDRLSIEYEAVVPDAFAQISTETATLAARPVPHGGGDATVEVSLQALPPRPATASGEPADEPATVMLLDVRSPAGAVDWERAAAEVGVTVEGHGDRPHAVLVAGGPALVVTVPTQPGATVAALYRPGSGRLLIEANGVSRITDLENSIAAYREIVVPVEQLAPVRATADFAISPHDRSLQVWPALAPGTSTISAVRLSGSRSWVWEPGDPVSFGPGFAWPHPAGPFEVFDPVNAFMDLGELPPPRLRWGRAGRAGAAAAALGVITAAVLIVAGRRRASLGATLAAAVLLGATSVVFVRDRSGETACAAGPAQASMLDGFDLAVRAEGLVVPTDIAALLDGRLLVAEKGTEGAARLLVLEPGSAEPRVVATFEVCDQSERGLVGLAVAPDFVANGLVYVTRTAREAECAMGAGAASHPANEVLELKLDPATLELLGQRVVLGGLLSFTGAHVAGGLGFGPAGDLFVAMGDSGERELAADPTSPYGTILRIPASELAAERAFSTDDLPRLIYATGLRNPFRFAVRSDEELLVADVGSTPPAGTEEVNLVRPGQHFGWPAVEGPSRPGGPPSEDPLWWYRHLDGCGSIIGGVMADVRGREGFVFGDFGCGKVWVLRVEPDVGVEQLLDVDHGRNITAFAATSDGGVVLTTADGRVLELVDTER